MGKREDILMATLDLITVEGLQSVTFAKIFKHAKVGSGTVYNYFNNKEELVNELYKEIGTHMSNFVIENYDVNETLYEKFKFFLKKMAEFAINYPKEIQFLENYSHSPYISEEIRNKPVPTMNEFFTIILEGQKQGIIREMNLMMCCQIVTGLILSVIRGFLNNKYPLGEVEIQQTIESCWKAIKI
ncbi:MULTISPECIES: TetR/AcrR family transcriptional regulator [Bacillus]|uniref:TetR family transcriptional regulator n=2 Tax=Bacillus TaxID=1386 RepID=A0A0M4FWD6_9BACI|nr:MULTISPECIES: TetR/AcrR family transcriptional regulator [Bacillus]ALC81200.1 TetR family transcriptional regulator [Bacillus gobiensis]MBP1080182.1 AcrR family transcriptional regulator [Bacillus capparidis]MED1094057.1 TetR/AcrR family transcriptional regulator [Bacillus capparidis]